MTPETPELTNVAEFLIKILLLVILSAGLSAIIAIDLAPRSGSSLIPAFTLTLISPSRPNHTGHSNIGTVTSDLKIAGVLGRTDCGHFTYGKSALTIPPLRRLRQFASTHQLIHQI